MPPKKKGNKKQQDDWEAELGESIEPVAQASQDGEADQEAEEEEGGGGGLMAALRKRAKKGKKGKPAQDFVEGEDPSADGGESPAPEPVDLAAKAPVEASMDDEDVIGQPMKKSKGGKGKQDGNADDDEDDDEDTGGRVKTKKEKEKEKKEREKQRKKEQVSLLSVTPPGTL